jgi:2-isopropylmalate synthase
VAASFAALEQATQVKITLKKFDLHSASIGEDAQGEVAITVQHGADLYRGNGASVDIVEAGARACLDVINRIVRRRDRTVDESGSTETFSRASI